MVAASNLCLHPLKDLFLHLLEVIAGLMLQSVIEWSAKSASSFGELEALKMWRHKRGEKGVCILYA